METSQIITLIVGVVVVIVILACWYADLTSDYYPGDEYEIVSFDYEPPEPAPRCLEQESLKNLQNGCCGACEAGCEARCEASP